MGTLLRHVLLLQKDIPRAARFYSEGLDLPIVALTDRWAELGAGPSKIALKAVDGCCPAHSICLKREGAKRCSCSRVNTQHLYGLQGGVCQLWLFTIPLL